MLPSLCQVITVEGDELPRGHNFVIVAHEGDMPVVFVAADDRSQLEARAAFLLWDQRRDDRAMAGTRSRWN